MAPCLVSHHWTLTLLETLSRSLESMPTSLHPVLVLLPAGPLMIMSEGGQREQSQRSRQALPFQLPKSFV